jgi:hypothetical protein
MIHPCYVHTLDRDKLHPSYPADPVNSFADMDDNSPKMNPD